MVQVLTSMDENATLLSIDGVGAYDSISRRAMFRGLADMVDVEKIIPFVRQFYDSPSTFLWEDDTGDVRRVRQGEGGEQGDPLMPLLFILDDIYVVCSPDRIGQSCLLLEEQLRVKTGISIHQGKTKLWNAAGCKPAMADMLTVAAKRRSPEAVVWKAQLRMKTAEQLRLLERITAVENVQAGWLLLSFCAATRSNYWLRTVCPELTAEFAAEHDRNVWRCLAEILRVGDVERSSIASSSLPLSLGCWSRWCCENSGCRPLGKLGGLSGDGAGEASSSGRGHHQRNARKNVRLSVRSPGLRSTSPRRWSAVANMGSIGRDQQQVWKEREPFEARGWQKHATVSVQSHHREHVVCHSSLQQTERWSDHRVVRCRQCLSRQCRQTGFEAEQFRVLLLRRLRLPLPLSVRSCRFFRLPDALGFWAGEGSRWRVLGARVSTNVMLRDLDISPPQNSDGRRLEVVAEGLTLFGGCQLALDATLVSPLHGDGTHRRGADITDGAALGEARKDKVRTYPELCRGNGRALLVVIAGEVGGRWSDETKSFLWCLASAKAAAVTGTGSVVQTVDLHARLFCSQRVREFAGWSERVTRSW